MKKKKSSEVLVHLPKGNPEYPPHTRFIENGNTFVIVEAEAAPSKYFMDIAHKVYEDKNSHEGYRFTREEYINQQYSIYKYKGKQFFEQLDKAMFAHWGRKSIHVLVSSKPTTKKIKDKMFESAEVVSEKPLYDVIREYLELRKSKLFPNKVNKSTTLTLEEEALLIIYDRRALPKNANKKLKEWFAIYRIRENRTRLEKAADNGAQTQSINKLKRIRKVIPFIKSQEGKDLANDEANSLESSIDAYLSQK